MASTYNISVTQGESFSLTLTANDASGLPINVSGLSISGSVKRLYGETGIITSLNPSGVAPLSSGYVAINLNSLQTAALPIMRGIYDIEGSSGNYCVKLCKGYFDVYPEVTT
jgi:hypothetical protein